MSYLQGYYLAKFHVISGQDRQCKYNVIMRHIRIAIVAVEKQ